MYLTKLYRIYAVKTIKCQKGSKNIYINIPCSWIQRQDDIDVNSFPINTQVQDNTIFIKKS